MTEKLALCIEDFGEAQDASRFTSCVALPRGEPGLGLDDRGRLVWADARASSLWIFVQQDGRLRVRMAAGAPGAIIRRAGREIPVPASAPGATGEAVLLDCDVLLFAGRALKVNIHGKAGEVHPPRPLQGGTGEAAPPLTPPPVPVIPFPPAVMPVGPPYDVEVGRQYARKLLTELAERNREALEEGRRRQDILRRLESEIDAARTVWLQKVPPTARGLRVRDFEEAVAEVLAQGKWVLLGPE